MIGYLKQANIVLHMKAISFFNKVIEYSFYLIFFFTPLIFLGNTSELFEFNKMWFVFIMTIIVASSWLMKAILTRKINITKTPLDIVLLLFFISQLISTVFSLDSHISIWGYYSRFNGGLLSTLSYLLLYYAFISNLTTMHAVRVLKISIASGIVTALWGIPSHFGYDPTCFVFRGTLDTNCWTEAFRPTIRVFSTLGQPAWFAAYLAILLPITMSSALVSIKKNKKKTFIFLLTVTFLFYACLIFANTRAGSIAFLFANFIFWLVIFIKKIFELKIFLKYLLIFHVGFTIISFLFGAPISALNKYTLPELQKNFQVQAQTGSVENTPKQKVKMTGITDSAQIRLIVWKGAIDAWIANPIFGTGVETFAFAYYKFRPVEHNMTSEWDYLYNKAHNEYLNYLATTGLFGLGTYLAFILLFSYISVKNIKSQKETEENFLLTLSLLTGFLTILITNFFGFSVVIINLYLFLIPAFIFLLNNHISPEKNYLISFDAHQAFKRAPLTVNPFQWILCIVVLIISFLMISGLFRYWYADTLYALGANLDHASSYQQAYPLLQSAVEIVPDEPVYKDEFAVNLATLSQALFLQKDASLAGQLAEQAVGLNNQITTDHPNNIVFWKNRLRIFYSLANADTQNQEKYVSEGLKALYKSAELAPTDAKISYNLGVLLGQTGNPLEATRVLEKTITLKPDYIDAYSALAMLYRQLAITQPQANASASASETTVVNPQWQKKAVDTYQFVLDNLSPDNEQIKKTLQSWNE